jgi:flavin-dependent dehydrogenase
VLFEGGYAGLQPVEGGAANLCLLVRRDVFEAAGAEWNAFLRHLTRESPHLRARLEGARPLLERPLAIAHVPYGFLHRAAPEDPDGLFRLGDQMGVIPSFSGDGISIAMHSAEVGAAMFLERGNAAAAFHRRMRAEIGRPIRLASMLHALSRGPFGRGALLAAIRICPGILSVLAARTRLPAPRFAAA